MFHNNNYTNLLDREKFKILPWCVKLDIAADVLPELQNYRDDKGKIDLGDSTALNLYNKAVAKTIANLDIDVPEDHLIPTVCLRQAYLVSLLDQILKPGDKILEIGTGASAIISLLAASIHKLQVVATEIDEHSYNSAKNNINRNKLKDKIKLIHSKGGILNGVIDKNNEFDALLCYPPTYPDEDRNAFSSDSKKGFRGTISEMIGGGQKGFEFTRQLLHEASSGQYKIGVITVLLIFKDHVSPSVKILEDAGRKVRSVELHAGSRIRYLIVAE